MAENLHQTLLEVARQLEEQLKFYRELGLTDIGDSQRDATFSPSRATSIVNQQIAVDPEPAIADSEI